MELIDKDALKDEIVKTLGISDRKYLLPAERAIWEVINKMPTIEERKTGKWVECDDDRLKNMCKCSECGAMIDINEKYRNFFCYHCGARMVGEEE